MPKCSECKKKIEEEILIVLVVDESSSMSGTRKATIDGINEFIDSQKSLPGSAKIMINTFSSDFGKENVRNVFPETDIKTVRHVTMEDYTPNGCTPLHDAFGETIAQVDEIKGDRRVMMVVITDGGENSSNKYNHSMVSKMVASRDWQFMFMGADIDAWNSASHIGGASLASNSLRYNNDYASTRSAYKTLSSASTSYRNISANSVDGLFGVNDISNTAKNNDVVTDPSSGFKFVVGNDGFNTITSSDSMKPFLKGDIDKI